MTYHYFKPHLGGVEEVVYTLSKKLVEENHQVTVITSNIGQKEKRPSNEIIDGINVVRCETKPFLFRTLRLKNFKEKLKEVNPDIFNPHHPIPGVSDTTVFYAKKNFVPSVLTYHADSAEDTIINKIASNVYYKLIADRMVDAADTVVSHTKSYAETSPVLKNHLDKVIINPIGVDTNKFNPRIKDNGLREKLKLKNKFIIFALGRMVPYKGYSYLIKAMKYLDNDYVLVLGGDGVMKNSLKELSNRLNLKNRVIFAGYLSEAQKLDYYAASDTYCVSSICRGEAFGITLLEAMACGKPVVSTNIPGVRDVASVGGILVKPRNPKAIADAIRKTKETPIDKNKLHEKIKDQFNWDKIVGRYISIYKELLG
jgi:glycosyltransferase involved in cell wall biosynthesis